MAQKTLLISGGGIAGLTLAIRLKELGWDPLVVERDPAIRTEGYMMDFFGTGWDVAERMGLIDSIQAIRYPIDSMQYVDDQGRPWLTVPIKRVASALRGKYTFLSRSDLERVLFERTVRAGISVRFGTSIRSIDDQDSEVRVTFENGETEAFALVVGADGVHSRVRELIFEPETQLSRYLGYYVAAFHISNHHYPIGRAFQLYEEIDRVASFYPLNESTMDATYVFRSGDAGFVAPEQRLGLLREKFKGAGWIAEQMLRDYSSTEPILFDSLTQISMPSWHKGRVALIGDACGCLTLLAGQGSHMAMAAGYVLANELSRERDDHRAAFERYQNVLKPAVVKKQADAARLSRRFVPSQNSNLPLRRLTMKLIFNPLVLKYVAGVFGARSILKDYR